MRDLPFLYVVFTNHQFGGREMGTREVFNEILGKGTDFRDFKHGLGFSKWLNNWSGMGEKEEGESKVD